jgi:hypothetical protein
MGASGRCNQLRELRCKHRLDLICLQETIKKDFSVVDINSLSEGVVMNGAGLLQMAILVAP